MKTKADLRWYVCDKQKCLYNAEAADRAGMDRCVKHGAILSGAWEYAGMTREEIRKKWKEQEKRDL